MKRGAIGLCLVAFLSSCVNSAQVQRNYIATRDQCRARAEGDQGQYTSDQRLSDRDRNAVLASLFSDCMFQMGWTVATPPREGGGDGGGGIIDTAREKPQEQALAPEQQRAPGGNVTLQPSPLPMSPTEQNAQAANKPVPADTQFPHSTYQSVPPASSTAKGNATQGGVAVVAPAQKPAAPSKPAPLRVKPTTTPAEKKGLTPEERKTILDSLQHSR